MYGLSSDTKTNGHYREVEVAIVRKVAISGGLNCIIYYIDANPNLPPKVGELASLIFN